MNYVGTWTLWVSVSYDPACRWPETLHQRQRYAVFRYIPPRGSSPRAREMLHSQRVHVYSFLLRTLLQKSIPSVFFEQGPADGEYLDRWGMRSQVAFQRNGLQLRQGWCREHRRPHACILMFPKGPTILVQGVGVSLRESKWGVLRPTCASGFFDSYRYLQAWLIYAKLWAHGLSAGVLWLVIEILNYPMYTATRIPLVWLYEVVHDFYHQQPGDPRAPYAGMPVAEAVERFTAVAHEPDKSALGLQDGCLEGDDRIHPIMTDGMYS